MMFSELEEAYEDDVKKWLLETIPELTDYQKESINDDFYDNIRCSDLYFYKEKRPQKVTAWWRLTILIFPFAWLMLFAGLPLNMIFTGRWGYSKRFNDVFLKRWWSRLNLY